jgi:hypothetical protein
MTARLEVHEHRYVSGRYANGGAYERGGITHSHQDGAIPHEHPDTGPASYTIDKDQWFKATGLKGGGRKKFTKKPEGPQLERVELEDCQKSFDIVFVGDGGKSVAGSGTGPGISLPARMILEFRMTPRIDCGKPIRKPRSRPQ